MIEPFEKFPERYDQWFKTNYYADRTELQAI